MVNETQVQDFCWSYWGRGVLSLLSWWEVTLGLPTAACHSKGLRTRSQSNGKRRRKLNPVAGGPGPSRPKANPTPKAFQLSQQMLIFAKCTLDFCPLCLRASSLRVGPCCCGLLKRTGYSLEETMFGLTGVFLFTAGITS